jgi:Ca2+-binding RTX toxin-like protein
MSPFQNHTAMGDLTILLTSSSGTVSVLHDRTGAGTDFPGTWTFMTRAFNGEVAGGTWSVSVIDSVGGDVGTLTDVVVEHHGAVSANDVQVFTNQYSNFANVLNAGRRTVTDSNGGIDTINAAAVTSASRIDLRGGSNTSTIDGVTLTISTEFENAIGGDGGDTLTGNSQNNLLMGMRGQDSLRGDIGSDTLNGGSGNDTMLGGSGNDTYVVNSSGDRVFETTSTTGTANAGGFDRVQSSVSFNLDANAGVRFVESLTLTGAGSINGTGNALNNSMTGNSGRNQLNGGSGNDTLSGGIGNDTLNGGTGNDTMLGGSGNDTYLVSSNGDRVFETTTTTSTTSAGGVDTVQSSLSFDLDAYVGVRFVERLTLTGTAAINGDGNALSNILTGNTGNNVLNGDSGSDTLNGGNGLDQLIGGVGNDVLQGGAGNDILTGGSGADAFVFTTTTSGLDVITDFNELNGGGEEGDVLRFQGLEVGTFVYRGSQGFTGGSNNSEARVSGNEVLIDTNGDGVTDIEIVLNGLTSASQLSANDFLFV